MTAIAYDKGYFFLRMLEEEVGREKWDTFLKDYFEEFAFKSMTTEGFLKYLQANLKTDIDVNAWVYGAGLPENCPTVETDQLTRVASAARDFLDGKSAAALKVDEKTDDWTTHHWNHFLRQFKEASLSKAQMKALDEAFELTDSGNSEITHDWMWLVIDTEYEPGYEKLERFLTSQGRRKFLAPLYRKLAETEVGTFDGEADLCESQARLSLGFIANHRRNSAAQSLTGVTFCDQDDESLRTDRRRTLRNGRLIGRPFVEGFAMADRTGDIELAHGCHDACGVRHLDPAIDCVLPRASFWRTDMASGDRHADGSRCLKRSQFGGGFSLDQEAMGLRDRHECQ